MKSATKRMGTLGIDALFVCLFGWFGWFGLVCWFGLVWFGLVWFGLVWFGFGLVWLGLVWFGLLVWCGLLVGVVVGCCLVLL